jgi:hypothetical protein
VIEFLDSNIENEVINYVERAHPHTFVGVEEPHELWVELEGAKKAIFPETFTRHYPIRNIKSWRFID